MAIVKTLIGNIKGPKGDTGEKGDKGDKGDIGATGQRGSRWTQGTAITGTSTTDTVFSESGISDALVNDNYLNTSTGNTYRCTVGGDASTAMWVYSGDIKGVKGDTGAKGDKGDTGATGPQGPQGEYAAVDSALSKTSTNPIQNKAVAEELEKKLNSDGDSKDLTTTFTSNDSTNVTEWTDVGLLTSGEKHSSLFQKVATMFKNIRYLYHMLGTADISTLGEGANIGTVTGAISKLNSDIMNPQVIPWTPYCIQSAFSDKATFHEELAIKYGKLIWCTILIDILEDINSEYVHICSLPSKIMYQGSNMTSINGNDGHWYLGKTDGYHDAIVLRSIFKKGAYYFNFIYFSM